MWLYRPYLNALTCSMSISWEISVEPNVQHRIYVHGTSANLVQINVYHRVQAQLTCFGGQSSKRSRLKQSQSLTDLDWLVVAHQFKYGKIAVSYRTRWVKILDFSDNMGRMKCKVFYWDLNFVESVNVVNMQKSWNDGKNRKLSRKIFT